MSEGFRIRGILPNGKVRAQRVDVREIASYAAKIHHVTGDAARLFSDGIVAAVLLAAYLDDEERLTLQVQGSSPRIALMVDVGGDGHIRAKFSPRRLFFNNHLSGVMLVMKSVNGKEVYRGATNIDHDSLEAVLQSHLNSSDQTAAKVRIRDGIGAFVEQMPDDDPVSDEALEELATEVLLSFEDGERLPLRWQCTCSRERVVSMLRTLGAETLQEMADEDGQAAVTCHFCNETELINREELLTLVGERSA